MISIACTQCQTVLNIDDAFAGGVCRCQHCGTIQTVPAQLKGSAAPQPYVAPSASKAKSLYQNDAPARMSGANIASAGATSPSGLDDLAQAVAGSSGLSGSGLQRGNLKATVAPAAAQVATRAPAQPVGYAPPAAVVPAGKKIPVAPIAIGAGVLILALLGLILFLLLGRGAPSTAGTGSGSGTNTGASFCGEAINGATVIYLLDDANSISNDFDPLKAATYQSIASLGSDHKFAVILWNNGEDFAFPRDGMAPANPAQVDALRAKLQDAQATGASHLRSALDRAVARAPAAIVLVTAKTKLDEDDESALAAVQDTSAGKTKFYTFNVGPNGDNAVLKMTAKGSGGQYRHLSSQELRAATP